MRTISVRLPVRNLQVSKAFFAELGFTFSPELSGEETACMLVDQNIYVMLVHRLPVGSLLTPGSPRPAGWKEPDYARCPEDHRRSQRQSA